MDLQKLKNPVYAVVAFLIIIGLFSSSYVIEPGYRGVMITLGRVSPNFLPEGFGLKFPFISTIRQISIRQQSSPIKAECYSSDLQQVNVDLGILYRVPETEVVRIYQEYAGDPFDNLIAPRAAEALKEITAQLSAELIVKKREDIKTKTLATAQTKIGAILTVEDIVIQNISLSTELEKAIEAKMVQEQEAAKAKFTQQKAEIEANTAIIKARGEAEAIRVRGQALRETPALIQLQIVEKWDGKSPLVVGGNASGANVLLPINEKK